MRPLNGVALLIGYFAKFCERLLLFVRSFGNVFSIMKLVLLQCYHVPVHRDSSRSLPHTLWWPRTRCTNRKRLKSVVVFVPINKEEIVIHELLFWVLISIWAGRKVLCKFISSFHRKTFGSHPSMCNGCCVAGTITDFKSFLVFEKSRRGISGFC